MSWKALLLLLLLLNEGIRGSDLGLIPTFVVSDSPSGFTKQHNSLKPAKSVLPLHVQVMRRVTSSAFVQLEKVSPRTEGSLCKPLS